MKNGECGERGKSAILRSAFYVLSFLFAFLPLALSAALSDWDQTIPWRYDTSGRAAYDLPDPTSVASDSDSWIDLRLRTVNDECRVVPHGAVIIFY